MKKLLVIALVAFAATLGLMALSAGGSASAQDRDRDRVRDRVSITCEQTIVPNADNEWVGVVECDINIDLPDPLEDISGTLRVRYRDRNQNGLPDFGDRKMCWEIDIAGVHRGNCPAQ